MEATAQQIDISREGVTAEKLFQLGRLFVPERNYAIAKVKRFNAIDIGRLNLLLDTNFRGVILDVDECVAPHHGDILPENVEASVRMVQGDVRIAVFSNMKASDRYMPYIETVRNRTGYEIPIVKSRHAKPDPRGFLEAASYLKLGEGEQAVMIGDNFVTDGGCIGAGIPFIKVDPVKTKESFWRKTKRIFQTGSRGFYSGMSDLYDLIGERRVLRDEHLLAVQLTEA